MPLVRQAGGDSRGIRDGFRDSGGLVGVGVNGRSSRPPDAGTSGAEPLVESLQERMPGLSHRDPHSSLRNRRVVVGAIQTDPGGDAACAEQQHASGACREVRRLSERRSRPVRGRGPLRAGRDGERVLVDSQAANSRFQRAGRDVERLRGALGTGHPAPAGRQSVFDRLALVAGTLLLRASDVGTEVGKLEIAEAEDVSTARITARSTTFWSSRMLPGHG